MARKTLSQTEKSLKAARANVAQFQFGTDEWEAAMSLVRQLADQVNAEAAPFVYTSIDGDIFDRR